MAVNNSTGDDDTRRPRGRPRRQIDRDAVADAVAALFAEGGIEAVSIARTADRLSVSRATLYRTVPTKADLLGILFERSARELTIGIERVLAEETDPGAQLPAMIRLQAEGVIQMRHYLPVFFGGGGLPTDVYRRWRKWTRQFERRWALVVSDCMDAGYLEKSDPVIATRLMLGMLIWVCRWYRPADKVTAEQIADTTISLLNLPSGPRKRSRASGRGHRRSS